jgi:hypothetical protein
MQDLYISLQCCIFRKRKERASEAGTGYRQHPGNVSKPKQGEIPAKTSKRERPEGSIPTEMIRPPKKPRDFREP